MDKLRELRLKSGLTQYDVVDALRKKGIRSTQGDVSRWELHGIKRVDIAKSMAEILDVAIEKII